MIVGMAVFFVIGGLGISAFIVWKSISVEKTVPAVERRVPVKEANPVSECACSVERRSRSGTS